MRKISIPKRSGGVRTIYVPNRREKRSLRDDVSQLNAAQLALCPDAHGFVPGRSVVTNAQVHVGWTYTLSVDLADFFDGVTPKHLREAWDAAPHWSGQWFHAGAARQGLPTSPAVANIAARLLDLAVRERLDALLGAGRYAYSRYADDLAISYDEGDHAAVRAAVLDAVEATGFAANPAKNHLQWSGNGRRVLCGVAIDADGSLHATRRARRKLRAAEHRDAESDSAMGLREWAKLRPPHGQKTLARLRVLCQGRMHHIVLRGSGEVVLLNHPKTSLAALAAAATFGRTAQCACELFACEMMQAETHGQRLPEGAQHTVKAWRRAQKGTKQ